MSEFITAYLDYRQRTDAGVAGVIGGFCDTAELQAQSNWCWAACATTVARYYAKKYGGPTPLSQCEMVDIALAGLARAPACKRAGRPGGCDCQKPSNGQWPCFNPDADVALTLDSENPVLPGLRQFLPGKAFPMGEAEQKTLYAEVHDQIVNQGRPVGLAVLDREHGARIGHFVMLFGVADGGNVYHFWDPDVGVDSCGAADWIAHGDWTFLFFTQP